MALYTRQSREKVRDAIDFVELVSARTELRRAGPARYEGLCPFHDERTASFGIDPTQKVYYCFGCQAAGDVFTFVQETEGVDFKEALELLAQRSGVELEVEEEDPQQARKRQRRDRLLTLLDRAAAYYERVLWDSAEADGARAYLRDRGLTEQALREYRVGFAPAAWSSVTTASLRAGFSESELFAGGLAQRGRAGGRLYDRFRGRIMFPLADTRGNVLGFGARAFDVAASGGNGRGGPAELGAGSEDRGPKYLNTSDNEIYHKGQHLYGAHLARAKAAKIGSVILCEGYTDVIALHGAGIENVVGLMGTALTADQVSALARIAPTVVLALDADAAGQQAIVKASKLLAARKLELRVVPLPDGRDPAELIAEQGVEAMRDAVAASIPFVRFRVTRVLASGDDRTAEGRDRIISELRPIFAKIPPSALRLELARLVAGRLSLPESLLQRLLSDGAARGDGRSGEVRGRGTRSSASFTSRSSGSFTSYSRSPRAREVESASAEASPSQRHAESERAFLALCLAAGEAGEQALKRIRPEEHFGDALLRRAAEHLLAGHFSDPVSGAQDDPQLLRVLAGLLVEAGRLRPSASLLKVTELQLELAQLDRSIQRARTVGEGAVTALARSRAEVKAAFDAAQEQALEDSGA